MGWLATPQISWIGIDKDVVNTTTIPSNLHIRPHPVNIREGAGWSQGPCLLPHSSVATILHQHPTSVSPNFEVSQHFFTVNLTTDTWKTLTEECPAHSGKGFVSH